MSVTERDPGMRWVGRTIDGRYRIIGLLGDGGMGSVYEAEHLALGKRVAFKVIHRELVRDEEARARFEREARATAAIEHRHVAAAMDFGRLPDGGAYLVVQLVQGLSLRQRVEAGPVAWREACSIGAQIADALAAIHTRGFVHRDLTADNVLLTTNEDGSPFAHVLDLGVAGIWRPSPDEPRLTAEGHVVGTPGYMPPEQALGHPPDPRADLYALGVLLWEMCAGRALFGPRELTQIVAAQLTDEPPSIPQLSSSAAPTELGCLIQRLLSRAPQDRPSDAVMVRDDLRRFALAAPAPERRASRGTPLPLAGAAAVSLLIVGALAATALSLLLTRPTPVSLAPVAPSPAVAVASAPPPPVTAPTSVPSELDPRIERLLHGRLRHERREVAERLRASSVPEWARAAADLELARTCGARRDAIERLAQAAEPAALPVLARLREAPTTGCGRGQRSDCYACVRAELERAWQACGGGGGPPR